MQSLFSDNVTVTKFPDSSISVHYEPDNNPVIVRARNSDAVTAIIQLARQANILHIPYFPFARQDHPPHSDLAAFISAIDAQRQTPMTIVTYDPHSEAVELLCQQTKNIELRVRNKEFRYHVAHYLKHAVEPDEEKKPVLIIPDAGAAKKYLNFFQSEFNDLFQGYILCSKFRDQETGNLSHFSVSDPEGFTTKPNIQYVILDDICDGGGTFIGIAEELQQMLVSPENLHLFISHGIFSKGTDTLFKYFSTIATTDSYLTTEETPDDRLIFYSLYPKGQ